VTSVLADEQPSLHAALMYAEIAARPSTFDFFWPVAPTDLDGFLQYLEKYIRECPVCPSAPSRVLDVLPTAFM
jgi:hypothetical protein